MPFGGAGEDLGGYKGYGWAAVELLCTAFQSGPGARICGWIELLARRSPCRWVMCSWLLILSRSSVGQVQGQRRGITGGLRASTKDPNGPGKIWTAASRNTTRSTIVQTGRLLGAARVTKAHGRAALNLSPATGGFAVPLRVGTRIPLLLAVVDALDVSTAATSAASRPPPSRRAPPRRGRGRARLWISPGNYLTVATCFDGRIWPVCTSHPTSVCQSGPRSPGYDLKQRPAPPHAPPAQSERRRRAAPPHAAAPAARRSTNGRARAVDPNTGRRPYRRRRSPLPCERPPANDNVLLARSRGARV